MSRIQVNCDTGRLQFATTRSDDGSLRLEDIAALPDLVSGALVEVAASMADDGSLSAGGLLSAMSRKIPRKAQALTGWFADNTYTLKKLAFVIDFVPPDRSKSKLLRMHTETAPPEYDFRPDLFQRLLGRDC